MEQLKKFKAAASSAVECSKEEEIDISEAIERAIGNGAERRAIYFELKGSSYRLPSPLVTQAIEKLGAVTPSDIETLFVTMAVSEECASMMKPSEAGVGNR